MAFRFRKSKKILPGVKLNIGKKSASVTLGGKLFRKTFGTTGNETTSVSIPGTGVYATSTHKRGAQTQAQKNPNSAYDKAEFHQQSGGIIHLNHIQPSDKTSLQAVDEFVAVGAVVNGEKIRDFAALKVRDRHIVDGYRADSGDITSGGLIGILGTSATLIGYDIRKLFPAFAALLRDVNYSAEWDYIDLKELLDARGDLYTPKAAAYGEAVAASAYFERARKIPAAKADVSSVDTPKRVAVARFDVVGESFRKAAIAGLCTEDDDYTLSNARLLDEYDEGDTIYQYYDETLPAVLVAEPDNPYDANAIAVMVEGEQVGYIARKDQAAIASYRDREDLSWEAEITGGPHKEIVENDDGELAVEKRNYDFSVRLVAYTNQAQ